MQTGKFYNDINLFTGLRKNGKLKFIIDESIADDKLYIDKTTLAKKFNSNDIPDCKVWTIW